MPVFIRNVGMREWVADTLSLHAYLFRDEHADVDEATLAACQDEGGGWFGGRVGVPLYEFSDGDVWWHCC